MKWFAQLTEDRGGARSHVALAARIRLPSGVFLPCTVRNISSMGAGLELTYEAFVPLQFRLQIPGDRFEADCLLRHRHGTVVGVEFVTNRADAVKRHG